MCSVIERSEFELCSVQLVPGFTCLVLVMSAFTCLVSVCGRIYLFGVSNVLTDLALIGADAGEHFLVITHHIDIDLNTKKYFTIQVQ